MISDVEVTIDGNSIKEVLEDWVQECIAESVEDAIERWMCNNELIDYLDLSGLPDTGIGEERAKEIFSSLFSAVIERVTKIAIGDYNNG